MGFRTDFQVPTETAAFLSTGDCCHFVMDSNLENAHCQEEEESSSSFIVATVTTQHNENILKEANQKTNKTGMDDDFEMSRKLNALGWTKVFIDVRDVIPGPSLFRKKAKNRRQVWENFLNERRKTTPTVNKDDPNNNNDSNNNTSSAIAVTARELYQFMRGTETLKLPLGHALMIANSKT